MTPSYSGEGDSDDPLLFAPPSLIFLFRDLYCCIKFYVSIKGEYIVPPSLQSRGVNSIKVILKILLPDLDMIPFYCFAILAFAIYSL